jgi:hypothetical protein
MNTDLVFIPGGTTSQVQVLDTAVKPFKDQQICPEVTVKKLKSVAYIMQWMKGRMIIFCCRTRRKLRMLTLNVMKLGAVKIV